MIDEYVLTPDVFDRSSYSRPDYIDMCLPYLKDVLYNDALVRDLRDGDWSKWCSEPTRLGSSHRLAKEILRKLKQRNRLRSFPRQSSGSSPNAVDWCQEALASHLKSPLTGVIVTYSEKRNFNAEPMIASIEKLPGCNWWQARSCSAMLERTTESFLGALQKILDCANSLMFIDPNLDPTNNYSEFFRLLEPLQRRMPRPRIELHRSFCLGDGRHRRILSQPQGTELFKPLDEKLKFFGLRAEVHFWQDFHARFLITDLIGILAEAGFDTTLTKQRTTWARLSSVDRDKIQRDFDPAVRPGDLKFQFPIGATE
ncbi:hypothetical protein [uncultured Thiocystis sp.]|jgi:hypothetical protein|uniref:hypothetical protein n=1 Tax=uncultured Thiocystis sp. TaxID=1202134 RepID=UPI0025E27032|nr:hypothetical protein [uncultured Thiocystis sp.]